MMASSKKKKQILSTDNDVEDAKGFIEYADLVVEDLKDSCQKEGESFEWYAFNVRSKFYLDLSDFHSRFSKGHRALMEELLKKSLS